MKVRPRLGSTPKKFVHAVLVRICVVRLPCRARRLTNRVVFQSMYP